MRYSVVPGLRGFPTFLETFPSRGSFLRPLVWGSICMEGVTFTTVFIVWGFSMFIVLCFLLSCHHFAAQLGRGFIIIALCSLLDKKAQRSQVGMNNIIVEMEYGRAEHEFRRDGDRVCM